MASSGQNYSYRQEPQLSASQVAEYLTATAARRKKIIQDAKFPRTSIVAQYNGARSCIVDFLVDGTRSLNHIADSINRLERRESRPSATEWVKRDSRFSIEAIQSFQRSYNRLGLATIKCERVHGRQPLLVFGPTKISVALDVITRKPNVSGKDAIGGVIFVFSRGERSSGRRADRCKTIAGLIYDFCLAHLKSKGAADTSICFGVDIFSSTAFKPQGTFARKRRQVMDACDEVADRWSRIEPPSDYDGPEPI